MSDPFAELKNIKSNYLLNNDKTDTGMKKTKKRNPYQYKHPD